MWLLTECLQAGSFFRILPNSTATPIIPNTSFVKEWKMLLTIKTFALTVKNQKNFYKNKKYNFSAKIYEIRKKCWETILIISKRFTTFVFTILLWELYIFFFQYMLCILNCFILNCKLWDKFLSFMIFLILMISYIYIYGRNVCLAFCVFISNIDIF